MRTNCWKAARMVSRAVALGAPSACTPCSFLNCSKKCCCLARRMILSSTCSVHVAHQLHVCAKGNGAAYVGDIHDELDGQLEVVSHYAADYIGRDIVSGVPKMRVVVSSRPTGAEA